SSSGAYNDTDDFATATTNNSERYEDPLSLVIHSFSQIALSGKEDSREGSGSDDDEEEDDDDDENDGQSDNFDSQQQYSTMLYVPCIDNNTDDDNNNDGDRYCVLSLPVDNSNNSDIANIGYNSSNPYSYSLILEGITSRPFGIAVLNSSYSAEAADASSSFSSSISEEIEEEEEQQPSETSFISTTTNEISNTSFGDNNNTTTELLIITSQQPSNITSARSTIYLAKLFSQTPFQDGSSGSSSNNLENTINGNNSNYDHQQQLPPPSLQALVDYPYGQLGQVAVVFVPPVTTSSSSTDDTTERNQAPSDTDEEDEDSVSSSPPPFGLNETTAFIVDFGDSSDSASAVVPHVPKIIMLDVETGNITPFLTPRPADPNFMPIDIAFDYNNNALYVLSIANNTDDLLDTGSRNDNDNDNDNNSGVIWKITYQGEEAEATTKSSNNGTDNNNNNATDGLSEPPPPPPPPSSSNDTDSSGNTTDSDDSDGLPEPPSPPSTDPPDDDPDDDNDPDDGTPPPPPSEPPSANEAPVANDQTIDIEEDSPPVEIELTATDNNEDDVLTLEFTIVSGPRHGTLGEIRQEEASSSENDDGNNNTPVAKATVTYTPDQNYTGQDNFQFKVSDDSGADSNIATVTINITPVNDIPIAENDTATTNQDTPVVIDVLANDSDIDGDSITIDSVDEQSIEGGSVRIISNDSGGSGDDNDNNGGSNANERIEYIPAEGFSGTDSFEYSISDGNAGGTDTATVTITVNAVNQPPVASNVQVTTEEDTPVPITLQATDEDAGDSLTFSISEAANGGEISEFDSQDGT
ncbi:MAG: Ig-like domain-containing protein, partial [Thermoproteota archaeon]|nr:Ig-like domain-containing protein [Thermoproteota archaeon]